MFRFKQFSVEHDRSSMKVGTDGVLLGAWCDVSGALRILDVGTGCGIIALMTAQRCPTAIIDALDIDHSSVEEAKCNFENSPWSNRLNAIEGDFNTVELPEKYDLIVSNPPFFDNGIISPKLSRSNARHTLTLSYSQFLNRATSLLNPAGKIAIVSPADYHKVILEAIKSNNLFVNKLIYVIPVEGKVAKRILWQVSKNDADEDRGELVIRDKDGSYTPLYKELCQDFYLKL